MYRIDQLEFNTNKTQGPLTHCLQKSVLHALRRTWLSVCLCVWLSAPLL